MKTDKQTDTIIVKAIRTNCITGKEIPVEVEICRKFHGGSLNSWWIEVIRGGITGYESMQESHVKNMTDGWSACAGTKGLWDSLFILSDEMKKISLWIEQKQNELPKEEK